MSLLKRIAQDLQKKDDSNFPDDVIPAPSKEYYAIADCTIPKEPWYLTPDGFSFNLGEALKFVAKSEARTRAENYNCDLPRGEHLKIRKIIAQNSDDSKFFETIRVEGI